MDSAELLTAAERDAAAGRLETARERVNRALELRQFGAAAFWERDDAGEFLARCLDLTRRLADARLSRELAAAWVARNPGDARAHLCLGRSEAQLANYAVAADSLSRCVELSEPASPSRVEAGIELAIVARKQERYAAAVLAAAEALLQDPWSRRAYLELSQSLSRLGAHDAASAFSQRARALASSAGDLRQAEREEADGEHLIAARRRARALARQGRIHRGEAELRRQNSPGARVYLVEYLLEAHHVAKAGEELEKLAAILGPRHPDVVGWSAMARHRRGDVHQAAATLADLCRLGERPLGSWAPRLASMLLEDLDLPAKAIGWLELYLERNPDRRARSLLARSLFESGRVERARSTIEDLPEVERQALAALWARCLVATGDGDRKECEQARGLLDMMSDEDRAHPLYHHARADWLGACAGDEAGATGARQRALQLEKQLGAVERKLRESARLAGREAAVLLGEAAGALWSAGRHREARRRAHGAVALAPDLATGWERLVRWSSSTADGFLRDHYSRRGEAWNDPRALRARAESVVARWIGGTEPNASHDRGER